MARLTTVPGTYRNGVVELSERPAGVSESARVLVTFLDEAWALEEDRRREAAHRLLGRIEAGLPFGGPPYPSREELHERRERPEGSR